MNDTSVTAQASNEYGSFTQVGLSADEDFHRVSIGTESRIYENTTLRLEFTKEFSEHLDSHNLTLNINFKF